MRIALLIFLMLYFSNNIFANLYNIRKASIRTKPVTESLEAQDFKNCNLYSLFLAEGVYTFPKIRAFKLFSEPFLITRGPYLQMTSETAITIRWRTNIPTDTKVCYGISMRKINFIVTNDSLSTEHEIRLTGLRPNTKYFYNVGNTTKILEGSISNYFTTAPSLNSTRKLRFVVFGDCGDSTKEQSDVKNAYLKYIGSKQTDAWLLLGDNAYHSGLDSEYQSRFFDFYKSDMLKSVSLFPTPGNHDYYATKTSQQDHIMPYYSNFTLPKNGECGGVVSNKEEYYSFNYANVHFISLDSYGEENVKQRLSDTLSPQVIWLKKDLEANVRKWTIVYFHHTPYTMGNHNSDTETELSNIRTNLLPILERNGVDLVLTGHSHVYERSYLMHDNFGTENTFSTALHTYSTSSAKYNGTPNSAPYILPFGKVKHGTVYITAGNAGQPAGQSELMPNWPHDAMYTSFAEAGSVIIEVKGNQLHVKMLSLNNIFLDQFTLLKTNKYK